MGQDNREPGFDFQGKRIRIKTVNSEQSIPPHYAAGNAGGWGESVQDGADPVACTHKEAGRLVCLKKRGNLEFSVCNNKFKLFWNFLFLLHNIQELAFHVSTYKFQNTVKP